MDYAGLAMWFSPVAEKEPNENKNEEQEENNEQENEEGNNNNSSETPAFDDPPPKDGEGNAYEDGDGETINDEAVIAARRQIATDFYKKYNPDIPEWKLQSQLDGIDFTKPVEVVSVPPGGAGENGNILYQYTKVNTEGVALRGEYYTNNIDATPDELGISNKYNVQTPDRIKTDEIRTPTQKTFDFTDNPVEALKSTASPINDDWSLKDDIISTKGQGTQYYIPKSQIQ